MDFRSALTSTVASTVNLHSLLWLEVQVSQQVLSTSCIPGYVAQSQKHAKNILINQGTVSHRHTGTNARLGSREPGEEVLKDKLIFYR